jgi:hypothetical protein
LEYKAEIIPKISPKTTEILIAETAKTIVFGRVSRMTLETFFTSLLIRSS